MNHLLDPKLRTILLMDGDNYYYFFEHFKQFNIKEALDRITAGFNMVEKPYIFFSTFEPKTSFLDIAETFDINPKTSFPGVKFDDEDVKFCLSKESTYSDIMLVYFILTQIDNFENLILMTSDQDFAPFIAYLQDDCGKNVQVIYNNNINYRLASVAKVTTNFSKFMEANEIISHPHYPFMSTFETFRPCFLLSLLKKSDNLVSSETETANNPEDCLGDAQKTWILIDASTLLDYFSSYDFPLLGKICKHLNGKKLVGSTLLAHKPLVNNSDKWDAYTNMIDQLEEDYDNGLEILITNKGKGVTAIDLAVFILKHLDQFDHLELYTNNKELDNFLLYLTYIYHKTVTLYHNNLNFLEIPGVQAEFLK